MTPVKIPASLVPRANTDFDMEAQQILGHDLVLADGFRIPPLTAGRLIALELISSAFFLRPDSCEPADAAAAIVLLTCHRSLVQGIVQAVLDSKSGPGAVPTVSSWLMAHADALAVDYPRVCRWILEVPFYGFLMRPGTRGPDKEFIFDGAFTGAVIAPASRILSTPVDSVLWQTPLCLVGHAIAQHDAACGVKGVERPPDTAVLDAMMREAEEREQSGHLHPWQYMNPLVYPLTDTQFRANPALGPMFENIRAEFMANGGRPVDPAKYPEPPPPVPEPVQPELPPQPDPGFRTDDPRQYFTIHCPVGIEGQQQETVL